MVAEKQEGNKGTSMNRMGRIWRTVIGVTGFLALILLLGAVDHERNKRRCKGFSIEVDQETGLLFLHKKDIEGHLRDRGDSLIGEEWSRIDLHSLEMDLERIPEVRDAEVFHDLKGTLGVRIEQRRPIGRFLLGNESFYWDREGERMPLSSSYTPRVPVITVDDPFHFKKELSKEEKQRLFDLLQHIDQEPFWNDQVQELHIDRKGHLEVVPLVGDHRILFGELKDLEGKLGKLRVFYEKAAAHSSLDQYDTLDLRYRDQVVAKRKQHGGT